MFQISPGFPLPFGATDHGKGINFSLFSKHATHASLVLFSPETSTPLTEISLDPKVNKTGDVWHVFVYDLPRNYSYGWRLDGPYDPLQGHYFDKRTVLLDPCAKQIVSSKKWGEGITTSLRIMRSVIAPLKPFNWEGDSHPKIPFKDLVIYEMHVRGFTADSSSKVTHPGTFLGLIEKIPFLKSLGVNAIELLPILEFNEKENALIDPKTHQQLFQFWGYSPISLFSLMNRYAIEDPISEFKTLVKALHSNGIEVILDLVYNHTAEGNAEGPLFSFKGIENSVYYLMGPNGEYYNFSGCGNTFNCNHPVVREMILASLRYFVTELHVDGFRFDLASILTRSHDGIPLEHPPLVEAITQDPLLANTKLIAEAWDAAGLYQVGNFPGGHGRWSDWNGRFRDDVRRFLMGKEGEIGHFATRLSGSSDLYGKRGKPQNSINFITAHDGFSLADLVSYNEKHNDENGEDNRDGTNDNNSWNCGVEGPSNDPEIGKLRLRQMKNFHLALMISQGVPMITSGDEYGHSKEGNNNSWSLDSRINWFQWDNCEKRSDYFRFFRLMIAFRHHHPVLKLARFLKENDVVWHGMDFSKPDWTAKSHFLACTLTDEENKYILYIAFNAGHSSATFNLPPTDSSTPWFRIADTSKESPEDFIEEEQSKPHLMENYTLPPHSSLLLKRRKN